MTDDKQELLEIYKLHSELADRVSQRREGANRLYVSLLSGVLVSLAVVVRFGTGDVPMWMYLTMAGSLGCLLSVAWYIVVRSYRQLNSGKFGALDELEKKLAYPFFKREWEILKHGKSAKHYWKLTVVETFVPLIFFLLFLSVLIIAVVITFGE